MKAKLLKEFRRRFYYSIESSKITLLDKKQWKEYVFSLSEPLELKFFIAEWKWGVSGYRTVWDNQRKKEKNILKRKYNEIYKEIKR